MNTQETTTREEKIAMLNLYVTQWMHRDSIMWKIISVLFYAVIICNGLLFFTGDYDLSSIVVFAPVIAFLATLLFRLISFSFAARLEAIGKAIEKITMLLPPDVHRIPIEKTSFGKSKLATGRTGTWLPIAMFWVLILIDAIALNIAMSSVGIPALTVIANLIFIAATMLLVHFTLTQKECEETQTADKPEA